MSGQVCLGAHVGYTVKTDSGKSDLVKMSLGSCRGSNDCQNFCAKSSATGVQVKTCEVDCCNTDFCNANYTKTKGEIRKCFSMRPQSTDPALVHCNAATEMCFGGAMEYVIQATQGNVTINGPMGGCIPKSYCNSFCEYFDRTPPFKPTLHKLIMGKCKIGCCDTDLCNTEAFINSTMKERTDNTNASYVLSGKQNSFIALVSIILLLFVFNLY